MAYISPFPSQEENGRERKKKTSSRKSNLQGAKGYFHSPFLRSRMFSGSAIAILVPIENRKRYAKREGRKLFRRLPFSGLVSFSRLLFPQRPFLSFRNFGSFLFGRGKKMPNEWEKALI